MWRMMMMMTILFLLILLLFQPGWIRPPEPVTLVRMFDLSLTSASMRFIPWNSSLSYTFLLWRKILLFVLWVVILKWLRFSDILQWKGWEGCHDCICFWSFRTFNIIICLKHADCKYLTEMYFVNLLWNDIYVNIFSLYSLVKFICATCLLSIFVIH